MNRANLMTDFDRLKMNIKQAEDPLTGPAPVGHGKYIAVLFPIWAYRFNVIAIVQYLSVSITSRGGPPEKSSTNRRSVR